MAVRQVAVQGRMHNDASSAGEAFDRLHDDKDTLSAPVNDDAALDDLGYEIDGEGGSRAWVGSVRRRSKEKRVVRVDMGSVKVEEVYCSALDDKIEVL